MSETLNVDPNCIAVVGIAGRFPAARTPAELWKLLAAGREATQWLDDEALRAAGVPEAELADPQYVRAALVLPDLEQFDAEFFGFSKRDAAILDPQHRHFLEACWEALEDAGHPPEAFDGAIGVFGGCGMQNYLHYNLLTNPELRRSVGMFLLRHTGNDKDFLCTRVSYLLDLKGPSVGIQTACSTSLVAVHVAAQSLLNGECDMALAGAASIELPHRHGYRWAEGEILAPDGHCRAFDEQAAGTLFGSGAAVVVLRRLEDAVRDRDNIYAVIRGSAVNNDGAQKAGYLAPSVDGQARAAVEALGIANVEPDSVQYIEAHGTGTPVGDPIEVAALAQAYGGGPAGTVGIGSLKTNIGHLDTAAGVASLIKVALALRHQQIPATLHYSRPNPRLQLESTPFRVVGQAQPWPRGAAPRRAAVNSLGVGGTNAHVIVDEPPLLQGQPPASAWQLLTLSARTPGSLERLKARWSAFLAEPPPGFTLTDAAFTLQEGRRHFAHRCAVPARDLDGLRQALAGTAPLPGGKAGTQAPPVVMLFPGGGASYPGAGKALLAQPAFAQAVDECFAAMPAGVPADLRRVMFDADPGDAQAAALLERPRYNIPALFVLEVALARLWAAWGVKPAAVIGHSAGEYAAAVAAGVMSLRDALKVVVLRGELFEQAPAGAMLAVDLAEDALRPLLDGLALDIAVVNAPDLSIASGAQADIDALQARLAQRGLQGRPLHIAVAAHSRLLDGILPAFRAGIEGIRLAAPAVPFVSNLSGGWADAQLLAGTDYWVRHLRETVRFGDGLQALAELGPDAVLLEVGPGQGLGALARQNLAGQARCVLASTGKAREAGDDQAVMLASLGALWARGLAPAWDTVRGGGQPRRISLPTYAFDHQRHWVEPGRGAARTEAEDAAGVPALRRLPAVDDWYTTPTWSPAPLPEPEATGEGAWLVFGGEDALTAGVLRAVAARRGKAVLVRPGDALAQRADGPWTLPPQDAGAMQQLLAALEQAGTLPSRVLHLWALQAGEGEGAALPPAARALAFDSLVHLAQALAAQDWREPLRLVVATAGAQAVAGAPVTRPLQALALGPVRVIPRELPTVSAVLLDLPPGADDAATCAALVDEALAGGSAELVGWREGARWVAQLAKAPAPAAAAAATPRLPERAVVLVTGGLGDLALELADQLAQQHRARLALVARRSLPPRGEWARRADGTDAQAALLRRLLALEAEGAEVATYAADVTDAAAMAAVLADVRTRWGAPHAVFHAAGTLQDAPIAAKTPQALAAVLAPKVDGARVLHALLPPGSVQLFAVYSSTSVWLGPPGQVDYVAANAFLDALAASRPDGLAIHWGIWSDTGMAARAYGRAHAAPAPASDAHPLLGEPVTTEQGLAFETRCDPEALWVLREHRVGVRAVLPGTAYIEIARAAMARLHPGSAVEIRSLSFEEAMVFAPGTPRQLRVDLRRAGSDYEFLVRSRSREDEPWQQHARATVGRWNGQLAPATRKPADGWEPGTLPQAGVDFGPRWHNVARLHRGGRRAVAEMALDERYAADLQPWALHPALTDIACTAGLHLLSPAEREGLLYVPLSVERIRIVAPLPLRSTSRIERREGAQPRLASFDVTLHTPEGAPVAAFEGFSLRGIDPQLLQRQAGAAAQRAPSLAEAMLAAGLRREDAPALHARLLAAGGPRDVVVSSLSLAAVRRAMAESAPRPRAPVAASRAPAPGAPRLNPVEAVLAEAWRELLGVDAVGREDDFFALGGHSLAAVRLFARIRKQWNVDLPLATLFQGSTLGALAAIVAEAGGLDTRLPDQPAPTSAPATSNVIPLPRAWSPLVPICRGAPGRRPLFCVHGAGGNVLNFKVISDRLGAQQPFYGLQAQGVDGRLPPLPTIEAMAAQYVEAVRSVDPEGPYRLAGYSGGGVIAWEMAQQLRAAGAQVEAILMIDTLAPDAALRKVPLLDKLWLKRHWTLDFALDWPARRKRAREMQRSYQLALEQLARGEPLPPELVDFHLFRNFTDAQAQYRLQPWDGEVVLFKAKLAETLYLYAGDALGWQHHVARPARVVEIAGSHFTMMAEPGVSELVEAIRGELARLDGTQGLPAGQLGSRKGVLTPA